MLGGGISRESKRVKAISSTNRGDLVVICWNCPKRHLYCHSTCEDYAKYKKKRELLLKLRRGDADFRAAKRMTVFRIKHRLNLYRKK